MRSPCRTIEAPSASVIHTSGEYGACRKQRRIQLELPDQVASRASTASAWRAATSAIRFIGATQAALLMFVMMRAARSSTAGASHGGPVVLFAPAESGACRLQDLLQTHRLAEADVHLAEALAQRRQRAQQREHGFLLLRLRRTARRCRSCLRPAARSRNTPARTPPGGADRAGSCAESSTACRSSAAAGVRCGCGRPR